MNDESIQPANIPTEILTHKDAIRIYLTAVQGVALIGISSVLGAIALSFFDKTMSDGVWTIAGIAVGALAVILGNEQKKSA